MGETPGPLDYRNPETRGQPRVGRNFAMGLLCGAAASGAGLLLVAVSPSHATLLVVAVLELGKAVFAIAVARERRRAGIALGLLVSLGVTLLLFGSVYVYAVLHC